MFTGSFWSPQGWEISRSDSYIHGHCALWIRCSVFLRQLKWSHEPLFHDNSNTTVSLTHTLALVISFPVPHTERETRILQSCVAYSIPMNSSGLWWLCLWSWSDLQLWFFGFAPDSSQRSERDFSCQRGNRDASPILPHARVMFLPFN